MAFVKLHQELLTSSIWGESHETRIVWITLLALADKNGEVRAAVPGLARQANVTLAEAEEALAAFAAPDKYSRTKDDEGRRLVEIDGGWQLLNYEKYRRLGSLDERREADRERQQRYRDKQRRNVTVTDMSQRVTVFDDNAEAEAEAEAEAVLKNSESKTDRERTITKKVLADKSARSPYSDDFELFWEQVPHKIGKGNAWKAWKQLKGVSAATVIAGLPGYRSSEQKRKGQDNGDFRPLHPATWLNGRRWEDEVEIIPDFSRRTEADFTDEDPPPF